MICSLVLLFSKYDIDRDTAALNVLAVRAWNPGRIVTSARSIRLSICLLVAGAVNPRRRKRAPSAASPRLRLACWYRVTASALAAEYRWRADDDARVYPAARGRLAG